MRDSPKYLSNEGTNRIVGIVSKAAAALMIRDGAPLFLVQRQLGHASVVTTQRYSHLYPSQATELVGRLDARYQEIRGEDVGLDERVVLPMPH